MATFALFISALCCVSAVTSSEPRSAENVIRVIDSSSDLPEGYLYDDMAKFYGAVESFDKTKLYAVIAANFRNGGLADEKVKEAFTSLYKVSASIKVNPMINSDLFKEEAVSSFSGKTDKDKFNAIFESIKTMVLRINHMQTFLKGLDWSSEITEGDRKKAEEYFKKHVYKEEYKVNVEGMAAVCKGFLGDGSDFNKLVVTFDDFARGRHYGLAENYVEPNPDLTLPEGLIAEVEKEVATVKPVERENNRSPGTGAGTSSQEAAGSGHPRDPAAPNPPQPGTPESQSPQTQGAENPSPDSSQGNLNGQREPAKSSFTYGGLTVATLCYFVLSAF
uniref:Merozoite surface antigen-1 n=1 Tax=Babesia bovis TaxID=5865 RepID=A0A173M292_BABBO|nr:merozoite surface antigen-1 [Babesia bovis]